MSGLEEGIAHPTALSTRAFADPALVDRPCGCRNCTFDRLEEAAVKRQAPGSVEVLGGKRPCLRETKDGPHRVG